MPTRSIIAWMDLWNRKLHIYIGLFFLWFLWLFSISGLLLNHPHWHFTDFWAERKQSENSQRIRPPLETDDLKIARNLMQQLGISGEIEWTTTRPAEDRFDFRVVKPGHLVEVKTDLKAGMAVVNSAQTNGWGILKMLHTFTGVRASDPSAVRDWWGTMVWSLSMDAVSLGLIFLVGSSLILWLKLKSQRLLGAVFLVSGILSCGFFVLWLP